MPTHDEIKAAGGNDIGDWGSKALAGAYPKGHELDVPDLIGAGVHLSDLASAGYNEGP
jgi:hypothetical protein